MNIDISRHQFTATVEQLKSIIKGKHYAFYYQYYIWNDICKLTCEIYYRENYILYIFILYLQKNEYNNLIEEIPINSSIESGGWLSFNKACNLTRINA